MIMIRSMLKRLFFIAMVLISVSIGLLPNLSLVLEKASWQSLSYLGFEAQTGQPLPKIVRTKKELIHYVNASIRDLKTEFSIPIEQYEEDMIPSKLNELEKYFISRIHFSEPEKKNGQLLLPVRVDYNYSGLLLMKKQKKTSQRLDKDMLAFEKEVDTLLQKAEGKGEYEKILLFHDEIIKNTKKDTYFSEAYGVFMKKTGDDEGYAEAMQLLLTLSGIENRVVWSEVNRDGVHLFNKVKMNGEWYNVDVSYDDPMLRETDFISHQYLLVTDVFLGNVLRWEAARYPHAMSENSYYTINKLTVDNQSGLEKRVKQAMREGKTQIALQINNYSEEKYDLTFLEKSRDSSTYRVSIAPSHQEGKLKGTKLICAL